MHITLVISSLGSGGAERVLSSLANHWVNQGHQVSVLTLSPLSSVPYYPLHPGIHLYQLDLTSDSISVIGRFKSIGKRLFQLRKVIKTLDPDVVVSFIEIMNITTLMALIGLKLPIIISERTDPHYYKIPKIYDWLRFKVYPLCYKLVVQTQNTANYFPTKFRQFIEIIPNAVITPQKTKEIERSDVQNIVSVGRLIESKGFQLLIHVFSKIADSYPKLTLTIYGEGPLRQDLEKLVSDLGLRNRVFLPGNVKNIEEKLVGADLFIFPSEYEGFPNVLCEAMAVGLPVIASDCSGNVDIIRDQIDGRLFPVGDQISLENLMVELIEDGDQRARLSIEAKKITKRFSEERIYHMWDEILGQVANYPS